jgi:hypothetical protein
MERYEKDRKEKHLKYLGSIVVLRIDINPTRGKRKE